MNHNCQYDGPNNILLRAYKPTSNLFLTKLQPPQVANVPGNFGMKLLRSHENISAHKLQSNYLKMIQRNLQKSMSLLNHCKRLKNFLNKTSMISNIITMLLIIVTPP